ncbi:MAG: patatin-like phospholipase family protein [Woeseiaceae bacterium]
MRNLKGQGLALSGGGYRASLFHLGVTRRLHELGVLQNTTRLSSVSGGSILAGFLAHKLLEQGETRLAFSDWEAQISAPFRRFVRKDIRTGLFLRHVLWNWAFPGPRAKGLERAFRKRLGSRRLIELPRADDGVEFIFLATDIKEGVLWRFSREKLGNYRAGFETPPDSLRISHAVAASASFPPIFGPIKLRRDGRETAYLTDGGVYDNTGMQPIMDHNKVVLISDAGAAFDVKVPKSIGSRIMRYVDIGRNQVGALRRRIVLRKLDTDYKTLRDSTEIDKPTGAFWRLESKREHFLDGADGQVLAEIAELESDWYGYPDTDEQTDLVYTHIGEIRTDMDSFTSAEAKILENHGYVQADLAIRRHARHLGDLSVEFEIPHRDVIDESTAREALKRSHSRLAFWCRWFD